MGFWGELWDGVKSAVSGAIKVVSNTVKTIGSGIREVAREFLGISENERQLQRMTQIVEQLARQPQVIIIRVNERAEEIGDKAMRADRKLEEFENVNKYIDYLRNEIKATPREKLEMLPPEERLARQAIGSALLSKAISEKKSLEIPVEFWKETVKLGLSAREIDTFLTKFKKAGVAPSDFLKYLKRELDIKEETKMDNLLVNAYKELEPNLDIKEIEEKVVRMQGI